MFDISDQFVYKRAYTAIWTCYTDNKCAPCCSHAAYDVVEGLASRTGKLRCYTNDVQC